MYCAINSRLKAFGVGAFCGDLCSEWLRCDRRSPDIYFLAGFGHQLYTIRRKHLFPSWARIALPSAPKFCPYPAPAFCHSYLNLPLISGLPGTAITPYPYGVPNGDGAGVGRVGGGRWEIVGCGWQSAEYPDFSLQLKFYSPFLNK